MNETDQWLTTDEAAKELNISPRTLNNSRCTGTGIDIEYSKIGSRIFYRRLAVEAYIKQHTYIHSGQRKEFS